MLYKSNFPGSLSLSLLLQVIRVVPVLDVDLVVAGASLGLSLRPRRRLK